MIRIAYVFVRILFQRMRERKQWATVHKQSSSENCVVGEKQDKSFSIEPSWIKVEKNFYENNLTGLVS